VTPSPRDEAQRRREAARRQRRDSARRQDEDGPAEDGEPVVSDAVDGSSGDTLRDTLRGAVKVAAAGAAVGAAAGAARAIAARDDDGDDEAHGAGAEQAEGEPPHQDAELTRTEDGEAAGPEPGEPPDAPYAGDDGTTPPASGSEDASESAEREHEPPAKRQDGSESLSGTTVEETTDILRRAREQLEALRGQEPESVSALERTATGWTTTFEVVELARVPDSTDVMASYEVVLDEDKNVTRYARVRRYYRSQAERDGLA
jgi:Gas vesicle synthesis protein GvpO